MVVNDCQWLLMVVNHCQWLLFVVNGCQWLMVVWNSQIFRLFPAFASTFASVRLRRTTSRQGVSRQDLGETNGYGKCHWWIGFCRIIGILIVVNSGNIWSPLVMTNSSPWKIPTINGGWCRWENHLWAMASMAMLNNQRVHLQCKYCVMIVLVFMKYVCINYVVLIWLK